MSDLLYKAVERILMEGETFSRNKNFDAFEDKRMKRALKIVKHLRSLRADLVKYGVDGAVTLAEVQEPSGGVSIELSITHLSGRRLSYLNQDELRLLRLESGVSAILDRLCITPVSGDG